MISDSVFQLIEQKSKEAKESLIVLTAYGKEDSFSRVNDLSKEFNNRILIIRGIKKDFLNGASDISVIRRALDNEWTVFINQSLHAKLYIFDEKAAIIGSANLTNSGLKIFGKGNTELVTETSITREDLTKISKIINESIQLSYSLLEKMEDELKTFKETSQKDAIQTDWKIFEESHNIEALFLDELLDEFSKEHLSMKNRSILSISEDIGISPEMLASRFVETAIYKWLVQYLKRKKDRCASFGEISNALHDSLISDKRIYRSLVKEKVKNLTTWVLNTKTQITIEKARHSSLFVLKDYLDYSN